MRVNPLAVFIFFFSSPAVIISSSPTKTNKHRRLKTNSLRVYIRKEIAGQGISLYQSKPLHGHFLDDGRNAKIKRLFCFILFIYFCFYFIFSCLIDRDVWQPPTHSVFTNHSACFLYFSGKSFEQHSCLCLKVQGMSY